jgi:hypothetical protein
MGKPTIYINRKIKNQILALSNVAKTKEWSGVLFYKQTSGSYKKIETLKFQALGIYPLKIGSEVFVEHEYSNSLAIAYDHFPIEASTGLIHSHNTMGVFFSGTDTETLNKSCHNYNFLLSFIVNVFGEYCAKIAFPCKTEVIEYKQYLDTDGKIIKRKESRIDNSEIVVDCEIIDTDDNEAWFNDKLAEIKKEATTVVNSYSRVANSYSHYGYNREDDWDLNSSWRSKATPSEAHLSCASQNRISSVLPKEAMVKKKQIVNLDEEFAFRLLDDYLLSDLSSDNICNLEELIEAAKIAEGSEDNYKKETSAEAMSRSLLAIEKIYTDVYKKPNPTANSVINALGNAVEIFQNFDILIHNKNQQLFDELEILGYYSKFDEIGDIVSEIIEQLEP